MPYGFSPAKNKNPIHPKVHYRQYLQYTNGPWGYVWRGAPLDSRTEQLIDNFFAKRRIRHITEKMRHHTY